MNTPLPKSLYGNVKMVIYCDIIAYIKNYMVVNELKSPYEKKLF